VISLRQGHAPRAGHKRRAGRTRALLRSALLGLAVLAAVVFGLGQLVLPGLAASRIRDTLLAKGEGVSVSVSAFPAVMLLFGHADSVVVHVHAMRAAGHGDLAALLKRVAQTDRLSATIEKMSVLGLELQDVSLYKRGSNAVASAIVTRKAIASALPADISLSGRQEGQSTLQLTVTAHVLGHAVSPSARLKVDSGALQIAPTIPLIGFLRITVFSDPLVSLDGIGMRVHGERYEFYVNGRFT
jgi:hypothetical protein